MIFSGVSLAREIKWGNTHECLWENCVCNLFSILTCWSDIWDIKLNHNLNVYLICKCILCSCILWQDISICFTMYFHNVRNCIWFIVGDKIIYYASKIYGNNFIYGRIVSIFSIFICWSHTGPYIWVKLSRIKKTSLIYKIYIFALSANECLWRNMLSAFDIENMSIN